MNEENKLDPETQKMLAAGQVIKDFAGSDGWKEAKKRLYEKLIVLDSISAMPNLPDIASQIHEYKVRQGVVSIITEWVKDIEGSAAQAEHVSETMRKARDESYIKIFG